MGCYVNTEDGNKERWLEKNGIVVLPPIKLEDLPDTHLFVCLVDNGPFTAAGIAYDKDELDVFTRPDGRQRVWFMVSKEKLMDVSDVDRYLEEGKVAHRLQEEKRR
jgi:hypothetical protein